ncbi:unnamed protein product, partial [Ectocarpus sp. 12 AP-2014]
PFLQESLLWNLTALFSFPPPTISFVSQRIDVPSALNLVQMRFVVQIDEALSHGSLHVRRPRPQNSKLDSQEIFPELIPGRSSLRCTSLWIDLMIETLQFFGMANRGIL